MIACIGDGRGRRDHASTRNELEDAIWVAARRGARGARRAADGPFLPPPPYAIAYTLLTDMGETAAEPVSRAPRAWR